MKILVHWRESIKVENLVEDLGLLSESWEKIHVMMGSFQSYRTPKDGRRSSHEIVVCTGAEICVIRIWIPGCSAFLIAPTELVSIRAFFQIAAIIATLDIEAFLSKELLCLFQMVTPSYSVPVFIVGNISIINREPASRRMNICDCKCDFRF